MGDVVADKHPALPAMVDRLARRRVLIGTVLRVANALASRALFTPTAGVVALVALGSEVGVAQDSPPSER